MLQSEQVKAHHVEACNIEADSGFCLVHLSYVDMVTICCRKIQVLGKHTKRILCGAWSKEVVFVFVYTSHL